MHEVMCQLAEEIGTPTTAAERLALLQRYARYVVYRPSRAEWRALFNAERLTRVEKQTDFDEMAMCFVCWQGPDEWHHIVQLQYGGDNRDENVVAICRRCHRKVHPWMRK